MASKGSRHRLRLQILTRGNCSRSYHSRVAVVLSGNALPTKRSAVTPLEQQMSVIRRRAFVLGRGAFVLNRQFQTRTPQIPRQPVKGINKLSLNSRGPRVQFEVRVGLHERISPLVASSPVNGMPVGVPQEHPLRLIRVI